MEYRELDILLNTIKQDIIEGRKKGRVVKVVTNIPRTYAITGQDCKPMTGVNDKVEYIITIE